MHVCQLLLSHNARETPRRVIELVEQLQPGHGAARHAEVEEVRARGLRLRARAGETWQPGHQPRGALRAVVLLRAIAGTPAGLSRVNTCLMEVYGPDPDQPTHDPLIPDGGVGSPDEKLFTLDDFNPPALDLSLPVVLTGESGSGTSEYAAAVATTPPRHR